MGRKYAKSQTILSFVWLDSSKPSSTYIIVCDAYKFWNYNHIYYAANDDFVNATVYEVCVYSSFNMRMRVCVYLHADALNLASQTKIFITFKHSPICFPRLTCYCFFSFLSFKCFCVFHTVFLSPFFFLTIYFIPHFRVFVPFLVGLPMNIFYSLCAMMCEWRKLVCRQTSRNSIKFMHIFLIFMDADLGSSSVYVWRAADTYIYKLFVR